MLLLRQDPERVPGPGDRPRHVLERAPELGLDDLLAHRGGGGRVFDQEEREAHERRALGGPEEHAREAVEAAQQERAREAHRARKAQSLLTIANARRRKPAFNWSAYSPPRPSFLGVRASGINPLGVLVAALIVSGVAGGWTGLKTVLLRIVRVRVRTRWYLAALLLPAALVFLSLALNLVLGAPMPGHEHWAKWPDVVDRFIIGFLFVGLGEEPGWRGYALPELQRRRSALQAALMIGGVWALWHVPLWGTEFPWSVVPGFLVSVFAGSVISAWLFNSARESVFLCMLFHASVNSIGAGYVFGMFAGTDFLRLWWIYAMVWAAGAVLIVWLAGPALQGIRRAQVAS